MSARNPMALPVKGEKWRYKEGRGFGSFHVLWVADGRVSLRSATGARVKSVSLRTLRSDYERVKS